MNYKKILAISPHTDDIELASGATIAKYIKNGAEVFYVAFSDCQDTLIKTKFKKNTLEKECLSALRILGIPKKNISIYHLKNKHFSDNKRKIFEILEKMRDKINPDIVLIPDNKETHQDHKTVSEQAISVFRRETSILCYEQPWNLLDFSPNFFVHISESVLKTKLKALACYKTQQYFKRPYFKEEFIKSLAVTRGIQIKKQFAESFRALKLIEL